MALRSLELVKRRKVGRRIVGILLGFVALVAGLGFIPWQQTVEGTGQVIVFNAMDRPQSVEAPIPARLKEWRVQEGQIVRKGDVLAVLEDVDSKFLDRGLTARLTEQRDLTELAQVETNTRVNELNQQREELRQSRQDAINAARQAVSQSRSRVEAAKQLVRQSEKSLEIASQVARQSASERARIQADRVVQGEQAVQAAKQQRDTVRMRFERIRDLEAKGLRSKQDLELVQNELVKSETEVVRAEKSLEIARRDLKLGGLGETQAQLEVERALANVDQAKANLAVAERDVTNASLNLSRITNDTAAAISRVGADIQSARESLAKNGGEIQKVENDLANLRLRTDQQVVRAPAAGRIARLTTVGAGTIVKSGDVLATIVPTTAERAVELFVTDNDVPWVQVGRPVRLQFAGWPAVQLTGMPGAAMGTFGGKISVIDPVDDGTAKYRVVITPEQHTLPTGRKDAPWPSSELLRPGAESYGWIMLDTVPLGFELWRQFNGFPPNASKDRLTQKKGTKDPALGPIKLKSK